MRIKRRNSDEVVFLASLDLSVCEQTLSIGDGFECLSLPGTREPVRGYDSEAVGSLSGREPGLQNGRKYAGLRPPRSLPVGTPESVGPDGVLSASRHGRLFGRCRDRH